MVKIVFDLYIKDPVNYMALQQLTYWAAVIEGRDVEWPLAQIVETRPNGTQPELRDHLKASSSINPAPESYSGGSGNNAYQSAVSEDTVEQNVLEDTVDAALDPAPEPLVRGGIPGASPIYYAQPPSETVTAPQPPAVVATVAAPKRRGRPPRAALTETPPGVDVTHGEPPAPPVTSAHSQIPAGLPGERLHPQPPVSSAPPPPASSAPPVSSAPPPPAAGVASSTPSAPPPPVSSAPSPPASAAMPQVSQAPVAPTSVMTIDELRKHCADIQASAPGLPFRVMRATTWPDGSPKPWSAIVLENIPEADRERFVDAAAAILARGGA